YSKISFRGTQTAPSKLWKLERTRPYENDSPISYRATLRNPSVILCRLRQSFCQCCRYKYPRNNPQLVVGRCKFYNDYFRNGCAATQNSCATKTNKNNAARLAVVLHDNDRLSLACWMASVARTLANITVFYRGSYRWMGIIFAGPPSAGNTATIW